MNLIVDIGNTRVKLAVVDMAGAVVCQAASGQFDGAMRSTVESWRVEYGLNRSIVSSTRGDQSSVVAFLQRVIGHCLLFDGLTAVPIGNRYSTPETLGRDRLAAAVGARYLWPDAECLIVDFGTAITIDLVSVEGGFEGGVISPGVSMRYAALHDYTASLPLCEACEVNDGISRTTREAIEQGVMRGICYEIEGYVVAAEAKYQKIVVIFTGGDAKYFDKRIKNAIFAMCDLVVVGLNEILKYNEEN
ncbi:MAG: type III pantothenate kinase [Rikenellaceae bacterium]